MSPTCTVVHRPDSLAQQRCPVHGTRRSGVAASVATAPPVMHAAGPGDAPVFGARNVLGRELSSVEREWLLWEFGFENDSDRFRTLMLAGLEFHPRYRDAAGPHDMAWDLLTSEWIASQSASLEDASDDEIARVEKSAQDALRLAGWAAYMPDEDRAANGDQDDAYSFVRGTPGMVVRNTDAFFEFLDRVSVTEDNEGAIALLLQSDWWELTPDSADVVVALRISPN